MRPVVLTIAGSDSSAGAGLQADLKTIEAGGAYAATVVTAVTAQSTAGVSSVHALPPTVVAAQLEAVLDDLDVRAAKLGMLASAGIVAAVAATLRRRGPRTIVCDPVLRSTSGASLLEAEALEVVRGELFPLATLLTPNAVEAALLAGMEVRGAEDAEEAGRRIVAAGAAAVLVTGGDLAGSEVTDVLVRREGSRRFVAPRLDVRDCHGTGCVLSAAIATGLALGRPLVEAIEQARAFVREALRHGLALGHGPGPVDPLFALHGGARRERTRAGGAGHGG